MSYIPNFDDPRVIARCRQAIGFACGVLSSTKSRAWSSRYIDRYFGRSDTDISKFLRTTLLICTDDFYRFNSEENKCKEYKLNDSGVRSLLEALKTNTTIIYPSVHDLVQAEHADELTSGDFQYKDQSNRLWHPLQRYRRQHRTHILADSGYIHDYDIATCAPTLIHQYAQRCGLDQYCFAINRYLNNKVEVRDELARALDLDIDAAKEIINALFAGAIISLHEDSDIYHILAGDRARIEYLKQDPFISQLKEDIKLCWTAIIDSDSISRRRNSQTNRLLRVTSKQKWHVYFELERQIIDSVRDYLDQNSVRYFLIHDGWSSDSEIDRTQLEIHVKDTTGYCVKFEYQKLTQQ